MFPKNFGNTQIIRFNSVIHFGGTVPLFLEAPSENSKKVPHFFPVNWWTFFYPEVAI